MKLKEFNHIFLLSLIIFLPFLFITCTFVVGVENDESATKSLFKISSVDVGVTYDVREYQNYGYATTNDGVYIIDLQNIRDPEEISLIEYGGGAFRFAFQNEVIYIAGASHGLQIYNISDKSNPELLSSAEMGGVASAVAVKNDLVFVSNYERVVDIYNCSDLGTPVHLSHFDKGGQGKAVQILNDLMYLANADLGLQVVNVSNPNSPTLISTESNTQGAWDIEIFTDRLYLGCHSNGLKILDLNIHHNPVVLSSYHGGGEAQGVSGDDELLFLVDNGDDGVELLNVSDPASPEKLDHFRVRNDGYVHDLYYNGTYAFISYLGPGFTILEYGIAEPSKIPGYSLLIPLFMVSLIVILKNARNPRNL